MKKEELYRNDYALQVLLNLPGLLSMIKKLSDYYLHAFHKDGIVLNENAQFSENYSITLEKDNDMLLTEGQPFAKRKLTLSCSDNRQLIITCAKVINDNKKYIYIHIKYRLIVDHGDIEYQIRLKRRRNSNSHFKTTLDDYLDEMPCTEDNIIAATYNERDLYNAHGKFWPIIGSWDLYKWLIDEMLKSVFTNEEIQMFISEINNACLKELKNDEKRIFRCLVGDGISR